MSKRDVLDKEMALRFAWRMAEPEAPRQEEAAPVEPAREPLDPGERRAAAEAAAERCRELAEAVDRAWRLTSPPHQAEAARGLLRLAGRLGLALVRMQDHPLQVVRLWRLLVRHRVPSAQGSYHLFPLGFMPVSPRQSEVVDLLVETAESGSDHFVFMLERQAVREEVGRRHPELGARLAKVVDEGRTWASRVLAARWLSLADFPAAIPALRRALRQPHARLRHCALFILPQMKGPALLEDDLLWLLEDAVKHPLPHFWGTESFDLTRDYEDALVDAVKKAPPALGWRPLEVIVDGGGAHIFRERGGLDSGWALRALAAGYPDRVLARIDRAMLSSSWSSLSAFDAVEAIGMLPEDLARPRLLAAAARPDHLCAERAKAIWFQRFGGVCPVKPLSEMPVELLSTAPSERMFACVTVLRGASKEARGAMMAVLLAEVPDGEVPPDDLSSELREVLALVIFTLRSTVRLDGHEELPSSEDTWVPLLLRRFGVSAFEALASMAECAALAGVPWGWLQALSRAARDGLLTEPQKARLRSIAVAVLVSPAWDGNRAPLDVLYETGAPPELADRLLAIVIAGDGGRASGRKYFDATRRAVDVLAGMGDVVELDARVVAAAEEAFRAGTWDTFESLVRLGNERGVAAVLDVAERVVNGYAGEPEAFGPLYRVARELEQAARIDAAWILERLHRPESATFSIAAHLSWRSKSEEVLSALRAALDSAAREGAAAAEAARTLVGIGALAVDDPRLDGLLERAPVHPRASLVGTLIDFDAPLSTCRRHVVDLLLSPSETVASEVLEPLYSKQPEATYELFEELLDRDMTENVRATMQHLLRAPNEAALYWQGAKEQEKAEAEGETEDLDDEAAEME